MIKEFNSTNYQQEVLDCEGKVFVKFSSPTCGPCRMMEPVMKQAAEKWADVKFGEVNVARDAALAHRYGIMAVPTLIVFKNGEIQGQFTGYMDIDDMESFFGEILNA